MPLISVMILPKLDIFLILPYEWTNPYRKISGQILAPDADHLPQPLPDNARPEVIFYLGNIMPY